jgi:hypothetical protein
MHDVKGNYKTPGAKQGELLVHSDIGQVQQGEKEALTSQWSNQMAQDVWM